ncbi:MAG: hypothetical protein ABJ375_13085 [Rhizobiaceae bacterium]
MELADLSNADERRDKVEEAISILEDALLIARAANLEEQAYLLGNLEAARKIVGLMGFDGTREDACDVD